MKSNGVKNRRRRSAGAPLGPSFGNFARVAAFVKAARLVSPPRREENVYEPATLIGPPRCLTSTREVLLTTSATVKRCRDHLRMCRLLCQRKVMTSPRLNGVSARSDGAGSGLRVVFIRC